MIAICHSAVFYGILTGMTKQHTYVTTAIPYANAKPHIGTAMDYLLASVWSRFMMQQGKQVRFQAGADEHGNKIAARALENNSSPQDFVDSIAPCFDEMATKIGAEYTDFIRTSSPDHIRRVQMIWQKLQPYIYKSTYEGWYCIGCENFVTDKEATTTEGMCPDHQRPYERLSEENYYFRASQFTEQIRTAIETGKLRISPEYRKKEFLSLIKEGMHDVSISRPRKNLSWGVPVPGDDSQVMYVWFDALSNYITVLGYPETQDYTEYWPADLQIVGKDVLRFHAGIWPAMLIGLGLPLPKRILAHGHVNVSGQKMSKSIGNVVDPLEVVDAYGMDAFRYYFTRHIPTFDDGDFTWEKFENAYNNELGNDLGNLVQRIASMVVRYQSGVIGEVPAGEHDMKPYLDAMEALQFDRATDEVWTIIRSLNQYLEQVKPWMIAKQRDADPEAAEHLSEVLAHAVGGLRQIASMLSPIMPHTSADIDALFANEMVNQGLLKPLFPKIHLHTPDPRAPKVPAAE